MARFRSKKFLFSMLILVSFFMSVSGAFADILGQAENFFVDKDFDKYSRSSVQSVLRHIGRNSYFYVEEPYWTKLTLTERNSLLENIKILASEFENNIYPKEVQFWGSEPNPGLDGDSRITFLVEDLLKNTGGYFSSANVYAKEKLSNSNEREMISLNADVLLANNDFMKVFIAHEFQHLISFNQKELLRDSSEDVWLNEVRSEYAVSRVGYNDIFTGSNISRRMSSFLENPSDSLTEWPNKTNDYGIANMFGEYIVEQYGKEILSETLATSFSGIDSINRFIEKSGKIERFDDIFLNWMAAVFLNDNSKNSRLGYRRAELKNFRVSSTQNISLYNLQNNVSYPIKDWQPYWLEYNLNNITGDATKSLKLDVSHELSEKFYLAYLAYYNSGIVDFGKINLVNGRGGAYILNSPRGLNRVIILATKGTKINDFSTSEPTGMLSVKASVVGTDEARINVLADGALIKRKGETEVYVIWGKYKRYLMPGVIALYGHLNPANAIELEPEIFHSYTTSNYVKYVGDEKVYAVWPDGTKHWLNITPRQWDDSGRDWGAIFTINEHEVNYYKTGENISR